MTKIKSYSRAMAVQLASLLRGSGIALPERLFRHLHFIGPFNTHIPDIGTVRLMSWGNVVENEIYWRGWNGHEPLSMNMWVKLARRGGDILDIGANTGVFAFIAKAVSPSSRVYAFEPVERIADLADKNREISGLDVQVIRCAVSDERGKLPIYDPGGFNAYSASLQADFLEGRKDCYDVDVTSIDDFSQTHGLSPRLIKIDVEGAEGLAICGAKQVLRSQDCAIICEWLGTGSTHKEAIQLLLELGYRAVTLDGLKPVDLWKPRLHDKNERNLLIAKAETLKALCADL